MVQVVQVGVSARQLLSRPGTRPSTHQPTKQSKHSDMFAQTAVAAIKAPCQPHRCCPCVCAPKARRLDTACAGVPALDARANHSLVCDDDTNVAAQHGPGRHVHGAAGAPALALDTEHLFRLTVQDRHKASISALPCADALPSAPPACVLYQQGAGHCPQQLLAERCKGPWYRCNTLAMSTVWLALRLALR